MVKNSKTALFEQQLADYHGRYQQHHGVLRRQLLDSLNEDSLIKVSFRHSRRLGTAVAAAAVIVLFVGVHTLIHQPAETFTPQAAWANVVDRLARVESIHFVFSTPGYGNETDSQVEMWWRRPGDFRIEFPNGAIHTGNSEQRCILDPSNNRLRFLPVDSPGLEMVVLGELGDLFATSDVRPLSGDWLSESKIVSSEEIDYRGERCLRVVTEKTYLDGTTGRRYEYIMNAQDKGGTLPLYEVNTYSSTKTERVISRVLVVDINRDYPESMFRIKPSESFKEDKK